MNINKTNINLILNRYISFVDKLKEKYNYTNNLSHILYIVVPAFLLKYGTNNEQKIIKLFEETEIIIDEKENTPQIARFERTIIREKSEYKIIKKVFIHRFNNVPTIELIDSLIHEFNHGVNSINNELYESGNILRLRTGIVYNKYDKSNLSKIFNKEEYTVLEEVLNTSETEEIINVILSLKEHLDIDMNHIFKNMLFALCKETEIPYKSKAYPLQVLISRQLLENKTFTSTLNNLRFSGNIDNIEEWFDTITGEKGSFINLCQSFNTLNKLEEKYLKRNIFKASIKNQIKITINKIMITINLFNNNCIYK